MRGWLVQPHFPFIQFVLGFFSLGGGDRLAMAAQLAWWSLHSSRSRIFVVVGLLFIGFSVVLTFGLCLYLDCSLGLPFLVLVFINESYLFDQKQNKKILKYILMILDYDFYIIIDGSLLLEFVVLGASLSLLIVYYK